MSKSEKTKAYIIEKTAPVFNIKGYAGTSLTDIREVTGLTKGAVYGNFSDKNELARAAYKYNAGLIQERILAELACTSSAGESMKSFTGYYRKNRKKIMAFGGCPMLNAAVEADDHLDFMKKPVQQSIQVFAHILQRIIEQGQKTGECKACIGARHYAYTLVAILEGGIMLAKIMDNPGLLLVALDRIDLIAEQEILV